MSQVPVGLVIFDCDGVLVDSEPIANRVFADYLREIGLEISIEEMYAEFVGRPMSYCMQLVEQKLGHSPPAEFVEKLQDRTFKAFETEHLQPMPGIEQALNEITLPMCVASSGELEKMRFTLGLTGLLSYFGDRLFSVTQVANGKPAPDIYLFAAQRMNVATAQCVVVEDSPVGAQAGLAAGMTVLGYSAHTDAEKLRAAGVQRTFADMRQLPALLSRAGTF